MTENSTCYIFDIDGTLADCTHRRQYVATKPKNWAAFNAGAKYDKPIAPVVKILYHLLNVDGDSYPNRIIICSGREEVYRKDTEKWLSDCVFMSDSNAMMYYEKLYMRKKGDYRKDDIIKEELLAEMRADGYNPTVVFDDRKRVVDMWVRNGLFVFDVAQGKGDF